MKFTVFSDEYFMKKAFEKAQKAFEINEMPVGAVIVSDNQIIAAAHNMVETLKDVTAHAEIIAITTAGEALGNKYLKKCKIFVTLEPCPMCAAAINNAQISELIYGTNDEKKGFSIYKPNIISERVRIKNGLMSKETNKILKDFFTKKRK